VRTAPSPYLMADSGRLVVEFLSVRSRETRGLHWDECHDVESQDEWLARAHRPEVAGSMLWPTHRIRPRAGQRGARQLREWTDGILTRIVVGVTSLDALMNMKVAAQADSWRSGRRGGGQNRTGPAAARELGGRRGRAGRAWPEHPCKAIRLQVVTGN